MTTVKLANFWWRVLGFIIDSILLGLVVGVPLRYSHQNFYLAAIVESVTVFFYGALFIGYGNGQTLGMRVARIRCVRADDRGKVEPHRAFRRALGYGVLLLVGNLYRLHVNQNPANQQYTQNWHQSALYFSLVLPHYMDLLWVAWDKQNQTLHDKFAGTIVLREPRVVL